MSVFGTPHGPEPHISDERIGEVLSSIKQQRRKSQLMLIAPAALVAAVAIAFVAAPPQYGELALGTDAEASNADTLPWVFGQNGVWAFAEPIAAEVDSTSTSPAVIDLPSSPLSPSFALLPPDGGSAVSLPVPVSTPPTPAPGESLDTSAADSPTGSADEFVLPLRPGPAADTSQTAAPQTSAPQPAEAAAAGIDPDSLSAVDVRLVLPELPTTVAAASGPSGPTGPVPTDLTAGTPIDDETAALSTAADDVTTMYADGPADSAATTVDDEPGAYPSTPPVLSPAVIDSEPSVASATATATATGNAATFGRVTVLVHSAHVSVLAEVIDNDSPVIDWCNTFVDWGDGSATGVVDPDGVAVCAASCESTATASARLPGGRGPGSDDTAIDTANDGARNDSTGVSAELEFAHTYEHDIDAAPTIWVATGDGCRFDAASFQLNPFSVRPY